VTAAAATFELERFAWEDGAFVVAGRWRAETDGPVGRAKLKVKVNGRQRRIAAQQAPPVQAATDGAPWSARFPCATRPPEGTTAELEVGSALVVELPGAELPPPDASPAPEATPADEPPATTGGRFTRAAKERESADTAEREGLEGLLEEMRAERTALESAADRLAQEREAAERAAAELERAREEALEMPVRPAPIEAATPRRAEIRAALERPREPRGPLDGYDPETMRKVAYGIAAALVVFLVLLLALML
jgi:hypothetical protein